MKQSWAFLLGDSLYSSKLRKSDGLDPVWYVKYGAAAGLGINQVLANEYLEDSGIGSHVEESKNDRGEQLDGWRKINPEDLLIQDLQCYRNLAFFRARNTAEETWFSESALCLNNKLSLTSAGFSFWKSFRIQWWA